MAQPHPDVPWVLYEQLGADWYNVGCSVCRAEASGTADQADQFALQHQEHRSQAQGFYGLGDVVAGVTGAFGMESCTPCEARRRQMNAWAPKVWWR